MVRLIALLFLAVASVEAQSPAVNYSSNLGVPGASAAALDSAGNLYITAGATLLRLSPSGAVLSTSTPVPNAQLTCVAVDALDRVIVGGDGFVARPPDFVTQVGGPVLQVSVDPNGNIYAATGGPVIPATRGLVTDQSTVVRLSSDGSITWTKTVGGASSDTPADMVVDAAGSLYLAQVTSSAELPSTGFEPLLNGVAGAVSYDGGGYFYPAYGVTAAINQWLVTDPNTLYIATQGQGVNVSTDRGQTFATRNQGLNSMTVKMLAVDPTSLQTLYAATGSGLAKTTNGGASWSALPLPSDPAAVLAVSVHPKNRAQIYVSAVTEAGCILYRSADSGTSWQEQQFTIGSFTTGALRSCIRGFLTDPNDVNGVYAISFDGVFAYGSPAWTQRSTPAFLNGLAADPLTFSTWYALSSPNATDSGIYKSTDKGVTWNLVQPGFYTAIAAGRPYVVAGNNTGSLTVSRDAGASWTTSATPAFAQPVRSLLSDSGTIFAGATYNPGIWLGKYSPLDGSLLQSTFLGGTGSETAARLTVDGKGSVTVAMESNSTDAPTTLDAAQRQPGGGIDILITRLTPAFGLQYASYFGGSADEHIGGIKLDAQGFLFMAGTTTSPDLPASSNALQPVLNAGSAAFATVFNPSANGLVYGSYYGGSGNDQGIALLPDSQGNAVLVGTTPSDSFVMSMFGLIGYQPITGIRNTASLVAGSLAANSLVTIDGSYGPVSGVSVMFNGQAATVVQSRDTSMDVAVPSGIGPGPATIVIQSRNGLSQGTVQVSNVAPGLFSANQNGKGVALATLVRVHADGTEDNEAIYQCTDTCVGLPIDFGDPTDTLFLQMSATGLRNESDLTQFQVTVAGQPATIVSAGPQGISPGIDQLTIQLPSPPDSFIGPAVWNIQVTVDGQSSNMVTISVG